MMIRDRRDGTTRRTNAAAAAKAMGIDRDEIAWAIEEYGRCDTTEYTAWAKGNEPPAMDEQTAAANPDIAE
jgi:hypothetical protein